MPVKANPLAFDTVVRERRSVRSFTPEPVDRETIAGLLELARWAPSPHNAQPWRFAVLRTLEAKEGLAIAMGERWRQDLSSDGASRLAIDIRTTQSYKRIVGAPIVLIACLSMEDMDRYPDDFRQSVERGLAMQGIGAFIQTLLLAAHERGLSAVWMCAPAFCPDVVHRTLDLPGDWDPHAMILLGHPAEDPRPPARMDPVEFVIYR